MRSTHAFLALLGATHTTALAPQRCPPLRATTTSTAAHPLDLRFDHVQIFADRVEDVAAYAAVEGAASAACAALNADVGEDSFDSTKRDVVTQLLWALQWRVVASCGTSVVVAASHDPEASTFVVTGPNGAGPAWASHDRWAEARKANAGRGSIGCLAFRVVGDTTVQDVYDAYSETHPALLRTGVVDLGDGLKSVEAYAYYAKDGPDRGTVLRFIERPDDAPKLPGLTTRRPDFSHSIRAKPDHWVSNVDDRQGFLKTLGDCLGYESQVEFASGVVAAGDAIIESTVAGPSDRSVFLPVNNALSDAGHVASFLSQLGNGVQHVATRVDDLLATIKRANRIRRSTGEGLAFLAVPLSYYGDLPSSQVLAERASVDIAEASKAFDRLRKAKLVDDAGVVALDCDALRASNVLASLPHAEVLAETIALSRYHNVYDMLGDRFDEATYVGWVRERVLVDVQGDDVLLQIFTRPILQSSSAEEAPFLEFIQRVCSAKEIVRPGCGGFGIRNFLVLFLSIELAGAQQRGDVQASALLREQLAESNPILSDIADAAALEADLRLAGRDAAAAVERRLAGQEQLQAVSARYAAAMKALKAGPRLN